MPTKFTDLWGHPGLAPSIWWLVTILVVLDVLYCARAIIRYRRLRPRTAEDKSRIALPLAGFICLNSSLMASILLSQLLVIGQAPAIMYALPPFLIAIGAGVLDASTR